MFCHVTRVLWLIIVGDGPDRGRLPLLNLSSCRLQRNDIRTFTSANKADMKLTTFSDGCLGSNNDEGRSEV